MGATLIILSDGEQHDDAAVLSGIGGVSEVLRVTVPDDATAYDRVHTAGMALQDWADHRHEWYARGSGIGPVAMVFRPGDLDILPRAISLPPLRGDELVIPTLDSRKAVPWVMGHPRAMLLWSLTVRNLSDMGDVWPADAVRNLNSPERNIQFSEESKMVWWAQRMNLRVYGLS